MYVVYVNWVKIREFCQNSRAGRSRHYVGNDVVDEFH